MLPALVLAVLGRRRGGWRSVACRLKVCPEPCTLDGPPAAISRPWLCMLGCTGSAEPHSIPAGGQAERR